MGFEATETMPNAINNGCELPDWNAIISMFVTFDGERALQVCVYHCGVSLPKLRAQCYCDYINANVLLRTETPHVIGSNEASPTLIALSILCFQQHH